MNKAVFLDRDGVLNKDHGYVHKLEDLELLPGVGTALQELKKRDFLLVVVSNQSGVGRGYFTKDDVEAFHTGMQELLFNQYSVKLDSFYVCYDTPGSPSKFRKPAPGMILKASIELQIDLSRSWMVGDRDTDIQCAINAGVRGIQVTQGQGHPSAFAIADSLLEALRFLI